MEARRVTVEAMCPIAGKRQMTYDVAKDAARRQRRNKDQRVAAYHCECGWWHVGGQANRGRVGSKKRFRA